MPSSDKNEAPPYNVMRVVAVIAHQHYNLSSNGGVSVELHPGPPPIYAPVNPNRLHKALGHIVNNAIKFTDEGGRVVLDVDRSEEDLRITVSDTGIGIDADRLPHLLERARQGDLDPQRPRANAGRGLRNSLELVEEMGGSIGVESEKGEGSTFTIVLPL